MCDRFEVGQAFTEGWKLDYEAGEPASQSRVKTAVVGEGSKVTLRGGKSSKVGCSHGPPVSDETLPQSGLKLRRRPVHLGQVDTPGRKALGQLGLSVTASPFAELTDPG